MKRKEFTVKTKRIALARSKGRCEAEGIKYGLPPGVRCEAVLRAGDVEFDHLAENYLTQDNSEENCMAVCHVCHRYKTNRGSGERAKMKRMEKAPPCSGRGRGESKKT